ncbi:hypothetical protein [Actinoplanes derwentensis]|uniref:ABC-2 type transport system ATP-binding protein n=1 Tax=Actinoplanes derwentensis TaxID=113562 RepID=A0A1H2AMS7_9ACTN|nr:hypothetical protein [Actinoplanes derwentensis]GID89291.1 hypothetical protein Ade03nite_82150 [Actinoplanes derwentensis]SDT47082.1 ABC-2 type transport system ATP-binding protein [Actinoplanes derwentensis]
MIAVVRSELYRGVSIQSSWLALFGFALLAALMGWFDKNFWSLFAGIGAFGLAAIVTAQHYQHRTAILLFLSRPHRWRVLAAQCLVSALYGLVLAAGSGLAVLIDADAGQYWSTVLVSPVMSIFGTLCVTVVRRPLWLFAGLFGWVLFAELLINKGDGGLPFASFMLAAGGNTKALLVLLGWTAAAAVPAAWAISRDLSGD